MKNTIHRLGNSWSWKSEIDTKTDDHKKKLSDENTLHLFVKLLIRAVVLAIGVAAVTGLVIEIIELFQVQSNE